MKQTKMTAGETAPVYNVTNKRTYLTLDLNEGEALKCQARILLNMLHINVEVFNVPYACIKVKRGNHSYTIGLGVGDSEICLCNRGFKGMSKSVIDDIHRLYKETIGKVFNEERCLQNRVYALLDKDDIARVTNEYLVYLVSHYHATANVNFEYEE